MPSLYSGHLPPRQAACGLRIADIQRIVAETFSVDLEVLVGKDRHADIALARHVGIYLAYILTDSTTTKIARVFIRDHTSVIHAIHRVHDLRIKDPAIDAALRAMDNQG